MKVAPAGARGRALEEVWFPHRAECAELLWEVESVVNCSQCFSIHRKELDHHLDQLLALRNIVASLENDSVAVRKLPVLLASPTHAQSVA